MTKQTCPRCGSTGLVPLQYGCPSRLVMEEAARGEVALGGCLVTGDDPRRRCRACGAAAYPDGVFRVDDPETGAARIAVMVAPPFGEPAEVSIEDGGWLLLGRLGVPPNDVRTVELMVLIQRFGGGADVAAWLAARCIPCLVKGSGPFAGVSFGDDVVLRLADGEAVVPLASSARVVLGCLADVLADGTFAGLDDFAGWLCEHGVEVVTAPPAIARL